MTLQYFANRSLRKGWYIAVSRSITANWQASNENVWTIPLGAGIGRVTKLGSQTANIKALFFGDLVYPSGTSQWKMQLQISFLIPEGQRTQ